MPMLRPRTASMSLSSSAARSRPSKRMWPPVIMPWARNRRMMASAITDVPEPLSPTMPTISPGWTAKLARLSTSVAPRTPRNATLRFSTLSRFAPISADLQLGIEQVPQSVAQQVEADDGDGQHRAAGQSEIWVGAQRFEPIPDHAAPARLRLLHAEPEQAERRLAHDDEADADRGADDQRRYDIGKDVPRQDASDRRAADDGRRDEHLVPLHQHERAREPRDAGPPDRRKSRDHGQHAGSEHRRHQDREHHFGEGEGDVDQAAHHGIDPAAEEARQHAERH